MPTAEDIFARVPKTHNCAQSVAAGCGGGRAPEGLCGALYAALLLLPESKREAAKAEFIRQVGAAECKVIKTQSGTPCSKCVAVGAVIAMIE